MKQLLFSLVCVVVLAIPLVAQVPPMIPNTFIQDHAGVLTADQRIALNQKVHRLDGKHIQLGVLIVQTTSGKDIAEFALEAGRAYGIGAKEGEHRGLLITLAIADRKSNIQVSRHLEGYITDGQTGNILRSLRSSLRDGDYNTALNSAVDQLVSLSANVPESETQNVAADQPTKDSEASSLWLLLLLLPVGVAGTVAIILRRRRRADTSDVSFSPSRPLPPSVSPPLYAYTNTSKRPVSRTSQSKPDDYTPPYVPIPAPVSTYEPPSTYESPSSSYDTGGTSGSFGGSSDFGGGGSTDSW